MKTIRIILFLLFAFSFSFADDDIPDVDIDPCEYGYSYDIESDRCYKDCTNLDLNKFGFPDESCIDCSSSRGFENIANCICTGLGSSWSKSTDKSCQYVADIKSYACTYLPWGGFIDTNCANGQEIRFKEIPEDKPKKDKPKKPKKDNELDFRPNKPNIGSGSGGSITIDNPNDGKDVDGKDKDGKGKDNDGKRTDSNGKSDSPKDGKGTDPNGKGKDDGKGTDPNGKLGGNIINNNNININGNEDGKGDDDIEFGKSVDYTDLNSANDNFIGEVKKGIDEVTNKFDDYLRNLDKLRNLFDTNGLNQLDKSSIPNTCPKSFNVPLGFKNQVIRLDLCNFLSDVSPLIYKIFYIFFFIMFLMICIKLFIFSF
ncbi:hypothetical protein [Campylobacter pinnipediorum]|uniref:hypothetical protein n=1 Tax=Campylobacter pinnipediorum TaxID=1965231 RepID=UPI000995D173|nr:hypothetical protein [Campylobacter pinnipediorum]AQW82560.1 putative membrane protein [Campylobacter pinnipediorum subsp. pinnipediorum]AQW84245.1 putative membrane protein [Campylobacter pinnipediorum subsp. pinnipediorum]